VIYRVAEDGDMIQFGPNCALSLEKVLGIVKESGPIVRNAFGKWLDDLKAQACADAFKPLADAAKKVLVIQPKEDESILLLRDIRDAVCETRDALNDVTANRRQFHTMRVS